ncbi:MAG TPA: hypothetical protein DDZ39_10705 [Flavobacteriaceae bacterium]|jgi:glycosyltransferase involved in cell wall biosynthesis|nr:hypothetical protein [Flavobacteriaceae bacterium]HBS11909.1 hypothetical protein [Flavobacteriaceae bacterium]
MKKKLWVVTYNFHPVWAGPAERFLRYYDGLTERDIEVTYITLLRNNQLHEEIYRGAKVIRLGNSEETSSIKKFIELATKYALKSEHKPDTFLVLLADNFNAPAIRNLSKNGIKTVYVNTMAFKLSNSRNILRRWVSKHLNYRFFKSFDTIVCSTEILKEPITKLGINQNKIKVISNGVSLDRFCPAKDNKEKQGIRNLFKLPDDEPIVIFVGLRVERKGVIDLVKSWQIYKEKGGEGYLLMVGDEQHENPIFTAFYEKWDKILATIKEKDKIIIHPPSSEIEKYFKISKLFVFLSKQEGMPNVIAESMASGCPVITTKFEGFSDTWGRNEEQLLVVNREHNEIATKIATVIKDDEYYRSIQKAALEFVAKEHAIECTLDKYANLV